VWAGIANFKIEALPRMQIQNYDKGLEASWLRVRVHAFSCFACMDGADPHLNGSCGANFLQSTLLSWL